jgi:hypothetical protein
MSICGAYKYDMMRMNRMILNQVQNKVDFKDMGINSNDIV